MASDDEIDWTPPPPRPKLPKITCPVCGKSFLEMMYSSHVTDHANEILPQWLYLGAERNAKQVWSSNPHKFTHVVCVAEEVPEKTLQTEQNEGSSWTKAVVGGIHAYHVPIRDLPGEELSLFSDMADELHRLRSENLGSEKLGSEHTGTEDETKSEDCSSNSSNTFKVLVHCVQGISRSTSVVIAYLMKFEGMRLKDAYEYVRKRRSIARPRREFIGELQNIEKKVFGCDEPSLSVEDTLVGTTLVNVDPRR